MALGKPNYNERKDYWVNFSCWLIYVHYVNLPVRYAIIYGIVAGIEVLETLILKAGISPSEQLPLPMPSISTYGVRIELPGRCVIMTEIWR